MTEKPELGSEVGAPAQLLARRSDTRHYANNDFMQKDAPVDLPYIHSSGNHRVQRVEPAVKGNRDRQVPRQQVRRT